MFPVILNFKPFNVLIVGGGRVAFRKAKVLLTYCDTLTIVSQAIDDSFDQLEPRNKIIKKIKGFDSKDLDLINLCIAATNDKGENSFIVSQCKDKNILVNSVTEPDEASCIFPAFFNENNLLLSVSTKGSSPAASRAIRDDLKVYCKENYSEKLKIVSELRNNINLQLDEENKKAFWEELIQYISVQSSINEFQEQLNRLNKEHSE